MAQRIEGSTVDDEPTDDELREHRRARATGRVSILDGLLRSMDLGLPLVEAVERCADRGEAQRLLTEPPFSFDEVQAAHILDLQLGRRTAETRRQWADEKADLERFLADG